MSVRLGRPTGLRGRLLAVVVLATLAALGATAVGTNVLLANRLDRTANDLLRTRVETELVEIHIADGRMTVPEFPEAAVIDEPVWIFAGRRPLERPRQHNLDAAASRLIGGPQRRVEVEDQHARLLAVPVVRDGRRYGTVIAAVSLEPYERAEDVWLVTSLVAGAVLLLAAILATRWVLAAGLKPVAQMTAQAAEWSERDLDRRFALGPPRDELTHLAATLDGLLGRLAAGLRREQRFSAELSHELRTPLARMRAQAQLALEDDLPDDQREAWASVLRWSSEMADTLDALLAGARADARARPGVSDARRVADAVAERFAPLAAERGVSLAVVEGDGFRHANGAGAHDRAGGRSGGPNAPVRAGVDADLLGRLLQPLVDNACRYATSEVTIALSAEDESVVIAILDDGPGVREDERERIFEPAVRGSAGTAVREGTGLGLALARRLAGAAAGSVEARGPGPAHPGGCFEVRVPRAS